MKTRNAEAPKSGAKKTPPAKAATAADKAPEATPTKPAPKSASGAKTVKKTTPKATPSAASDPKQEVKEPAAPADEKKPVPVKSPEKKVTGKAKLAIGAKVSASPKVEEAKAAKAEVPSLKIEEESKEDVKAAVAASEMETEFSSKNEPESESVEKEDPVEEEEPMDGDEPMKEDVEQAGDEVVEEEGVEGEEVGEGEGDQEEEVDAQVVEEEQNEISDMAKARKIKKELEIFVGGLDRDAVEDDLRKVFEKVGEVVDIRLHKDFATNKNKGFAFVRFANKEQVAKVLAELKSPMIRGKRCGIAPSEDNDTLFVGNICNTWTKEAIKRKMKDYGIDNVESVTLVADSQNEGLSRGFAFVEFACHADAMTAYKRFQKPDVVFGHPERTAKVAFAEPIREPDPEVMAQVKSVFVDGLPPYWDEDRVKEQFKGFGEIDRVVLARNMSSAKRNDFGFVNFTTHEAAVACVEGVHNTELGDGKTKMKAKARLANPLPKTQAVKGGMSGGFRIGHTGSGVYNRFARGFPRGGRFFPGRAVFQRGRGLNLRGRGRGGRFPFVPDRMESSHTEFRGRRPFGVRGGRVAVSTRGGAFPRGRGRGFPPRRQPFSPEEDYGTPYNARFGDEDPYLYDDGGHGVKRPFAMMDRDSGYLDLGSRLRPRYDHPDSMPDRYRGSLGSTGLYSHDYYGSDYGGSSYSSLYGGEQSGRGYYY